MRIPSLIFKPHGSMLRSLIIRRMQKHCQLRKWNERSYAPTFALPLKMKRSSPLMNESKIQGNNAASVRSGQIARRQITKFLQPGREAETAATAAALSQIAGREIA
jgi:hypothetical protein